MPINGGTTCTKLITNGQGSGHLVLVVQSTYFVATLDSWYYKI